MVPLGFGDVPQANRAVENPSPDVGPLLVGLAPDVRLERGRITYHTTRQANLHIVVEGALRRLAEPGLLELRADFHEEWESEDGRERNGRRTKRRSCGAWPAAGVVGFAAPRRRVKPVPI